MYKLFFPWAHWLNACSTSALHNDCHETAWVWHMLDYLGFVLPWHHCGICTVMTSLWYLYCNGITQDDLLQTSQSVKSNTGWTQKPYSAVLICNRQYTDQNINANSKNDIYWQLYLCNAMNDKHLGLFTCVWERTVRVCEQLMITEMIAGLRGYKTWKGNGSMYIIHTNPSEDHTHTPSNSLQKE